MSNSQSVVFTIGHSNLEISRFLRLLRTHHIDAVVDVRSTPYSRRHPSYNAPELLRRLKRRNIRYFMFGAALGGRPSDPRCYIDGELELAQMREIDEFQDAMRRIIRGSRYYTIALLCAEADPIRCHRFELLGDVLVENGIAVHHVLTDGSLESQATVRLRQSYGAAAPRQGDLLREAGVEHPKAA